MKKATEIGLRWGSAY